MTKKVSKAQQKFLRKKYLLSQRFMKVINDNDIWEFAEILGDKRITSVDIDNALKRALIHNNRLEFIKILLDDDRLTSEAANAGLKSAVQKFPLRNSLVINRKSKEELIEMFLNSIKVTSDGIDFGLTNSIDFRRLKLMKRLLSDDRITEWSIIKGMLSAVKFEERSNFRSVALRILVAHQRCNEDTFRKNPNISKVVKLFIAFRKIQDVNYLMSAVKMVGKELNFKLDKENNLDIEKVEKVENLAENSDSLKSIILPGDMLAKIFSFLISTVSFKGCYPLITWYQLSNIPVDENGAKFLKEQTKEFVEMELYNKLTNHNYNQNFFKAVSARIKKSVEKM